MVFLASTMGIWVPVGGVVDVETEIIYCTTEHIFIGIVLIWLGRALTFLVDPVGLAVLFELV